MSDLLRPFNEDFDAIVARYGQRIAMVSASHSGCELTYRELDRLMDRHLAWFQGEGLRTGDCIAALMPNSMEQLCLFLACLRGGMRFAPIACDSTPAEITQWVEVMKPALCCIGSLVAEAPAEAASAQGLRCLNIDVNGQFAHLPEGVTAAARRGGAKLLLFTSGTTGQPKALVIDGDRLWSAGLAFLRSYGVGHESRFRIWNYLPHSYLGGLFNMGLIPFSVAGSTVVDETFSGKTFLRFWQTVDRYEINVLWLVPTIVKGLLSIGERIHRDTLKSYRDVIRFAFLGTAPIELGTKRRFEALFGIPLLENFALSETTFLSAERPAEDALRSEGSAGAVLPYVSLRFRPDEEEEDPLYREILASTPFIADGYRDADGGVSRPDEGGFFPTGDLGYLSPSGQLVITGRSKEIIKKGGHFIALREMERIASGHPLVAEAVAVPVSHVFYGESYRLCIRLKQAIKPDGLKDVRDYVYSRVARHKWPEDVEVVSEFPRTASGKVRKFLLRNAVR